MAVRRDVKFFKTLIAYLGRWFNPNYHIESESINAKKGIDWVSVSPFLLFHLMCFGIIWVGWSPFAVWFTIIFYIIRMFGITGFYHRYFAHHAFTANRFFSFLFAFLGCSAMQKGPLWWAAIHRHHHRFADTIEDVHSPKFKGFWWSHIGWILARENQRTRIEYLKDWLKFPELVMLDKFAILVPFLTAILIYFAGDFFHHFAPQLHTSGIQLLIWGFLCFYGSVQPCHFFNQLH